MVQTFLAVHKKMIRRRGRAQGASDKDHEDPSSRAHDLASPAAVTMRGCKWYSLGGGTALSSFVSSSARSESICGPKLINLEWAGRNCQLKRRQTIQRLSRKKGQDGSDE